MSDEVPGRVLSVNLARMPPNPDKRGAAVTGIAKIATPAWRIGDWLVLAVTVPRIPCGTFRAWIAERGWLRTFTRAAIPGTYLRVVTPGQVRAGDPVSVVHRPTHGVSVAQVFRATTLEPDLLPSILAADDLIEETREMARAGRTFSLR